MRNNKAYHFSILSILIGLLAICVVSKYSQVINVYASEKNSYSNLVSEQCYSNYCIYLPIVINSVPEIDIPSCRWSHSSNNILYITYKWGNNLQTPGTTWRNAFEAGLNSWKYTTTLVWFYYDGGSRNIIITEYNPFGDYSGRTVIHCIGYPSPLYTDYVEVFGNLYWDYYNGYTIYERRGLATHEVGHAISIGHIPNWYPIFSIMYKSTPLNMFDTFYDPQIPDVELVNQIYP